jgi:hypothetical protein
MGLIEIYHRLLAGLTFELDVLHRRIRIPSWKSLDRHRAFAGKITKNHHTGKPLDAFGVQPEYHSWAFIHIPSAAATKLKEQYAAITIGHDNFLLFRW